MATTLKRKRKPKVQYLTVTVPDTVILDGAQGPDGQINRALERQALEGLVVETAYDAYAHGAGNRLGPCSVRHNATAGTYNLNYVWANQWTTATNITSDEWTTAPTWANLSITGVTSSRITSIGTATSITDWLPTGDMGDVEVLNAQVRLIQNGLGQYLEPFVDAVDYAARGIPIRPLLTAEQVKVINKKAAALLLQYLTEAQRQTWLAEQYFDVQSPSGNRYRLTRGHYHNVFLLDQFGNRVREYCAYAADPGGRLPVEDNLFAQLMALRFDEADFLAAANTWDLLDGKKLFVGKGVDAERIVSAAA